MSISINGPGTREVRGPTSSTDNAVVRWDGTSGQVVQDSGVLVDDNNSVTIPGGITVTNGLSAYTATRTNTSTTNINQWNTTYNVTTGTVGGSPRNYFGISPVVSSGASMSGSPIGLDVEVYRNNGTDAGTIASMRGLRLKVGVGSSSVGSTISGDVTAVDIDPRYETGTISGSFYCLRISSPTTGGTLSGTLYGIYQQSTAATNHFAGRMVFATASTPASASATGVTGTVAWDSNFIYVCTATNTWKRAAISTW